MRQKRKGSNATEMQSEEGDTDMNAFSFPTQPLKRSASLGMMIQSAYLEGGFGTHHSLIGSIDSKNRDTVGNCDLPATQLITANDDWPDAEKSCALDEGTGHSGPKGSSNYLRMLDDPDPKAKNIGDALMGSPNGPSHDGFIGLRVECKPLEKSAFGSFISHDGTSGQDVSL
eukprot:TRINITY_DN4965_c0_g1_i2.p1 TRINITY_DN4965_c0_g1~~TRINITY_DN4965_c0_g1_i2.p1  ORF type:complete len:172 (-),score=32.65 TRINITY_DN4965_c0_g1_i2:321-836(-)